MSYRIRLLRVCMALLFPFYAISQVSDNFSDGDFITNPAWLGNTSDFVVSGDSLQSNGPQASSNIYLSTPSSLMDSTEWNFLIRLNFNPSSTNQVRVYLVSDQQDLSGSLNGYYVQFGESGTAPDSLDVFLQSGTVSTKVFTGVSGIMSSASVNSVRVRIVRHTGGTWDVYADKTGGNNLTAEGSFSDNTFSSTSFFGVVCDYTTASRYNLYYFDDIAVGYIVTDTTKPVVSAVNVLSNNTVDVKFSEPVTLISAQTIGNYVVDNGVGTPTSALRDASDFSLVHLTFSNAFQNSSSYNLSISNVKDINGNTMNLFVYPFSFFIAGPYDILINEIMADPDPVVGLPSVEFVELFNTTSFPIALDGWKFSDASTTVSIPPATIPADSFIVLVASANLDSFPSSISKVGLPSLPSLNNSGDLLTLKNASDEVIHSVDYIDDWYNSTVKNDGGWTLELINPEAPCSNTNNWNASQDLSGGTPGRKNSVYNTSGNPVLSLIGINVLSASSIELLFSENLDKTAAQNAANYTVDNGVGNPASAQLDTLDYSKVMLLFSQPFDSFLVYTITASVINCSGVIIGSSNSFQFAIPQQAEKFDVLINEIFPDPEPIVGLPAAEYIEVFNRSNKAINLKDWELSKAGSSAAVLPSYLLLPDSFVVLFSSTNSLLFSAFSNTLSLSGFPSLTNTGDNLLLKNNSGLLVHYVPYSDTWYANAAKQDGGWALELIDSENPCSGKDNWRASTDASGGTPGSKNSVVSINPDTSAPKLIRAALSDQNTLVLYFSEPLNNGPAAIISNYNIDNSVGSPALALPIPFDYTTVQLEFTQNFQPGVIYNVTVTNLSDCSGNEVVLSNSARFAISDTAVQGDIVINELLFNPRTSGYDFLELYNRSNKVIDLIQIDVLEKDFFNPDIVLEQTAASSESYLLFPGEYVVLSQNIENIRFNYFCQNEFALLQTPSLPNFDDNGSICLIKVRNGATIDSLQYISAWHFALLDDENGVSLERIDFNAPSQDKSSWHSAASTVGFATPTYLNSQYSETGIAEDAVSITPAVFSPDNDGDKDVCFIQYNFTEPGYTCNIAIYDAKGREIKQLVKNELLGSTGQFQWDGIDNDNRKARVGIYVAFVEVFNLSGRVKRFKKELVLGGKLN